VFILEDYGHESSGGFAAALIHHRYVHCIGRVEACGVRGPIYSYFF
jgi:hypothetical protein